MDILLIILLSIPLFLVRVGNSVRKIAGLFISKIIISYNIGYVLIHFILSRCVSIFRKFTNGITSVKKPSIPRSSIPATKKISRNDSFRQLRQIYKECFFTAIGIVGSPLSRLKKIPVPVLRRVTSHIRNCSIIFSSRNIRSKTVVLYPVPITVAWKIRSFFAGILFATIFVFIPYQTHSFIISLPRPNLLSNRNIQITTKIYDRNGNLLYEIYADENRTPIPLSQIPKALQNATIAIEDRDFYRHNGFSSKGIIRAMKEIVMNHNIQGGSTITQQLIKSALLTPEVTVERKVKEIFLAFWAERIYSKDQILEMYLNQVPYGGMAWGVEAASHQYFGKPVKDLTLAEAALLAGLPAAPTDFSPLGSSPQKAFQRQHEVIRRMKEDRYISDREAETALNQKISFATPQTGIKAPHFVMFIKQYLEKKYGPRMVASGGLRVFTTLDLGLQEKVEDIVKTQIDSLSSLQVGNGAALVTDPKNGEILAMVGSKDYFDIENDGNVNVTTSLRQPGSSIKVVTYTAALENGFTAASIIADSPITYRFTGGPNYTPVNYDGKFHGPTPLRYALGNSYNIPAVKVLEKIGVKTMIEKGRLMGISSWEDDSAYGLSLALGGGDVTMLDMAMVYGSLANKGIRNDLISIKNVTDYTGQVIETQKPNTNIQATSAEASWLISNILSDNNARAASFGTNSSLVISGKTVSVKTGTSNDKRDNWTIGYTPSVVVTVWVGNNDNSPMHPQLSSGVTGAAPIWHDIMTELINTKPDEVIERPANISEIPCYSGKSEFFIKGTEPASGRCLPIPTPAATPNPASH